MRYLFGFLCVCALCLMPMVGCSDAEGTGGSGGDGGEGGTAGDGGSGGQAGNAGSTGVAACSYGVGAGTPCREGVCLDDFNECTANDCADETCVYSAVEDGTPCDEDNECIVSGACIAGGCSATPVEDGTPCGNGAAACVSGSCSGRFECSKAGIREAIAVGGGPHTFDCNGPTTVPVSSGIYKDVILDGEGKLTLGHPTATASGGFSMTVAPEVTVTLRRLSMRIPEAGLNNSGRLTLVGVNVTDDDQSCGRKYPWHISTWGSMCVYESTVSDGCSAIFAAGGSLEVVRSTIRDNSFTGISVSFGSVTLVNTTLSNNEVGIVTGGDGSGSVTILSSTIVGGTAIDTYTGSVVSIGGSIVHGHCGTEVVSLGDNLESPGITCGFDQPTDQIDVSADDLKLGELADNGGPTMTHALLPGSVAIDVIPEVDCVNANGEPLATDQRGIERPQGPACDVGSFEVQP